ncbi:hypothetical protein D3C86_1822360 [compost metagenome]
MRILGTRSFFGILARSFRNKFLTVLGQNQFLCLILGRCGDPSGVGTHVSNQTDRTFLAELYSFIQLLGH